MNSKYAPSIIESNESPDLLNVIANAGAVETRQGMKKVNTASVGTFACDGIYSYRNNQGAESMCAFFGGSLYTLSGTTFASVPSAQSVFTAGVRIASEQDENYIYFCNGNVLPYKYNGAFTRHGVYPPTSAPTANSAGTGALVSGTSYIYAYTFVNTNVVESDLSPLAATFSVTTSTNGQITVSGMQTAPVSWGVNNGYLYRTKANTGTPFYRVATFTNGTTSVTDNVADTSLTIQAPTDNGKPPKFTTIVYAEGRLFCNDTDNPNQLWFSNAGNPYSFPSTNFLVVGDSTSDLIKGLAYYGKAIVIFCERSIWFLYMPDSTTSNWVGPFRSNSSYGSLSPYGIVTYNNKLFFPAVYNQQFVGYAALSGNVLDSNKTFLTVSTAGSDLKSDRIEPDMNNVSTVEANGISSIVYKKKIWSAVSYSSTTNNRIYQFDFSASTIKPQEFFICPFTGMDAAQFCVFGGKLYYGTSDLTGFVYQCESGNYNDDGGAINSYIWTKEYSCSVTGTGLQQTQDAGGSDTHMVKDFRYVNLLADTEGAYYMNFIYRLDSDKGAGTSVQINLNPGGSLWGTLLWGGGKWGGGASQIEPRVFLGSASGRRIQFRFDNQNVANQKFKVHGFQFLYNLKGIR